MRMSTFLQLFLIIDVFFMGVLASIAVRHGRAHFWHKNQASGKAQTGQQNGHLPPSIREQMLEEAQANFQKVLNRSTAEMQKEIEETAGKLNKLLDKVASEAVSSELTHYQETLEQLRKQTETDISGARAELTDHQAELKAKLAEEMTTEKQQLMELLDSKLSDAVASFLLEALQHEVDLGAQSTYLTKQLEEHKADLIKGIVDET